MQYDLIIIGAGPAAYTASIYASRYKIKHIIIGEAYGGLMAEAHKICNYPSEIEITGMELMQKMQQHAESYGVEIKMDRVVQIKQVNNLFQVATQNSGEILTGKVILLATGTKRRKLNLPREQELIGKGISYCATCDAMFYKGKKVAVVGGSNSALTAALYLAEVAEHVYQIYRGDELRGETVWVEQVKENPKIEVIYKTNVVKLLGVDKLSGVELDPDYNGQRQLKLDGLFVEIGSLPEVSCPDGFSLETDAAGYLVVNNDQSTNLSGVWAAGDITNASNNLRQIVTACSEGAIAAESIFKFLKSKK